MSNGSFGGKLTVFADNTAYVLRNHPLLQTTIQEDLNQLKLWFNKNKMLLRDKTTYAVFNIISHHDPITSLNYFCSDNNQASYYTSCSQCLLVKHSLIVKYLGVTFYETPTKKHHIC